MYTLGETKDRLLGTVDGLSDAQWRFKAGPDRWSVCEVIEHLARIEEAVNGVMQRLPAEPPPASDRNREDVDAIILRIAPDRSSRIQAPDRVAPSGTWNPEEALSRFVAARDRLIAASQAIPDLRDHSLPHPILGPLDGDQWILTTAAHTERHLQQIREILADPRFPASAASSQA